LSRTCGILRDDSKGSYGIFTGLNFSREWEVDLDKKEPMKSCAGWQRCDTPLEGDERGS